MRLIGFLLLVVSLSSVVSATNINFNCPDSVEVDAEFTCLLHVLEGSGVYDVKVGIEKDGKSVARIFNEETGKWGSAYFYLKEFIEPGEEKEIKLKVEEVGDYAGDLKLRQETGNEFFGFDIIAASGVIENNEEGVVEEEKEIVYESDNKLKEEIVEQVNKEKDILINEKKTISLNSQSTSEENELIYESKNSRNVRYLPYAFSFFLILVLVIIIWDKF